MGNTYQQASQNLSEAFEQMETESQKILNQVWDQTDRSTSTFFDAIKETLSTGRQVSESLLNYSFARNQASVDVVKGLVDSNSPNGNPK